MAVIFVYTPPCPVDPAFSGTSKLPWQFLERGGMLLRLVARCLGEEIQEACDHPRTNNRKIVCSLPFYGGGFWLIPPLAPLIPLSAGTVSASPAALKLPWQL